MPKRRNSASTAAPLTPEPPLAECHLDSTGVETADVRPPTDAVQHYARCEACKAGVHFTPCGSGFSIVTYCGYEHGTSFGVGPNGFPVCPVPGHGEMQLADEQLKPAHEAIAEAAEKVTAAEEPSQPKLFQTFKPFNSDAALKQIAEKNRSVQSAKSYYDGAKGQAATARKAWEREAEQLQTLIAEYDRKKKDRDQQIANAKEKARLAEEAACAGVQASESENPPVLSSEHPTTEAVDVPAAVVQPEPQPDAVGASA